MCCENFWKKAVPFAIALTLGVFISGFIIKATHQNEIQVDSKSLNGDFSSGNGIGTGSGGGSEIEITPPARTNPLQIISKPRPSYTDAARQNQVTGVVRLHVTFLASGQIGSVSPVSGLPNGLTEQAIAAALNIKFEPATVNGQPITITKLIEYSFTIY